MECYLKMIEVNLQLKQTDGWKEQHGSQNGKSLLFSMDIPRK